MKEKIELGKVREFGDIISDSFIVVRQNIKPLLKSYLVICGMFLLAGILISVVADSQEAQEGSFSIFSFWGVVNLIFSILEYTAVILTTVAYLALYRQKGSQSPTIIEVWEYFKYYFFRVLSAQVVISIVVFIATMLCIVPGIYLFPIFALVTPIMVIENTNTEYAIRKAFKIIKENWWFTFGVLLLISIIVVMAMFVFVIPVVVIYGGSQWLTGNYLSSSYPLILSIVTHLCQVLWLLPIISVTLVYYSLTEHKEAGSLINRIKMFGKNDQPTDQFPFEQY